MDRNQVKVTANIDNHREIEAEFARLRGVAPNWSSAQRRQAVIDTFCIRWSMPADEVSEIVDEEMKRKVPQKIAALHDEAQAADNAFQRELVRVYGERNAGDARYYTRHDDPLVQAAGIAKIAADDALLSAMRTEPGPGSAELLPCDRRQFHGEGGSLREDSQPSGGRL